MSVGCLEQSEGDLGRPLLSTLSTLLNSPHLISPLLTSPHNMGNYSSSWSSPHYQDSAGELSGVSLSGEEETVEVMASQLTVNDFPSEVWACVIAFLPFREKVNNILVIILVKI